MQAHSYPLRAAIALVLAAAASAPAAAQQRAFDIPATDAASALPEYGRQAGVQIVAPGERLQGVHTPALKGEMDAHAALAQLLQGTGLRVLADDGRTITLGKAPAPAAAASATASGAAGGVPAVGGPAPATTIAAPVQTPPQADVEATRNAKQLQAVTVTGTFIRRIDVETALPLTTLGQDDIELSGATTASDLLSQLPQSAAFDNSETSTGPNDARGDGASVNLRGLGSGNTLVLLNGRRIAPYPIASGAVPRLSTNINQIPLGAIQRIEVLRDGASALYGSDAVAGVVNTVLKTDYEGAEADVRYGHVADGGMGEKSATFLAGHNFDEGRTNVMGFVGYYDRDALQASQRDFASSADLRDRAHSDNTRWDNRSLSGPYGNFLTGTANPDGSFSSHVVSGMGGSSFHTAPGADGGVDVVSGSLPRDLRYDFAPDYVLSPKTTRYQVFTALNHEFSDTLSAFANYFYYRADSHIANAAVPISANSDNDIYVPASNYYNPFGTRFYGPGTAHPDTAPSDVLIKNYRPVDIGLRTADVRSRAYQVLGGLRGMAGDWNWEVGAQWGEGKTTDIGGNMISESRLRRQLALDTPDAFNPFGGPGANSQDVLDAVRIDTWRRGKATLGIVDAKATGDLFELPGGYVQAAFGLEYRHEGFRDRRDGFSLGDDVIAQSQSSDAAGSRNVKSAFAEFSVPIFSEDNAIPGFRRLELSLAGRSERYSDFGTASKPKFGIAWSPAKWVLLRGSYSEGFRAPTLAQVFVGEIVRRNTGVPDPYRADVTGSAADLGDESRQVIRGGNPDLGPEEAKEHSIGVVLQPPFVDRLTLSLDYFQIRQSGVIDTYGEEDQLQLDYQLRTSGQGANPDVVRLPVTAADQAAFDAWNAAHPGDTRTAVGAVDYVRDTYINIAQRKVSGLDFGLRYNLDGTALGDFRFRTDVAYLDRFDEQRDASSPRQSQLEVNGRPRTRGVASVHWSRRRLDAGLQANYIGHFRDTSAPTAADGSDYKVDSWLTFNAFLGVHLGADRSHGSYLRFGVNNLFDKDPPLADESKGYYDTVHDPRGRFLFAEWRVRM